MSKTLVKQIFLQDSFWAINKSVALIYGLDVALFLSFLIDKHDQCVNDEEYFYATKKDAEYQTGLTRYQQDLAVKTLVDNGLIYARAFGLPPKMHYHIRYDQIAAFFENANNLLIKKRGEKPKAEAQNNSDTISKKFTNRAEKELQNNITKNIPLKTKSIKNKESKSVVTDTPPLAQTFENSDLENRAKNLKGTIVENHSFESENLVSLKEKSTDKKPNSGGRVAQNSQPNVSNSNKPKKPVREWFKLASLTDTQKAELNALAGKFDNPSAFIESLDKWLVYKESGQVNFTLKKIPPYKDFDTMLSTITTEAKRCRWQSEVFVSAVKDSINKLYFGLFPEKFISQTVKNGNFNSKIDRATANNNFMESLRRGENLPDFDN